ncbi:MAG: HD domain-containing protein [Candidatus Omnitrophica bacterium]|nr:HD domain-containing protein [Candidatus Omnitrophota bacterium]
MGKRISGIVGSSFLLRRFTIFFFAFSVTPLILLFYLFTQYKGDETIIVNREQLTWFTLGVAVVSILGFFGVRNSLKKIVILSSNLKKALFEKVDEKVILDLAKGEGETAELAKAFGEVFRKLEGNIRELEYTKKKLHEVLSKVGKALASVENFDLLIQLILETAVEALGTEKGVIFSFGEECPEVKASVGFADISSEEIIRLANSSINWAVNEKKTLFIPALEKEEGNDKVLGSPLVCTPLIFHEKVWGVLCLSGKKTGTNFSEDELKMISNLSYQMAISFENLNLNRDIERTHFETIAALALAVEAKDPYSQGHSESVGERAVEIGKEMGLSEEDLLTLRDASRLHDLGKIGIADNILKKESGLSPQEKEVMVKHPTIGESIVRPLKTFQHLLDPIRHHHEMLDGSGYPDGLKGDGISLITRILTVADIYNALATNRPYRKALKVTAIKKELQSLVRKGKVDDRVVKTLFKIIDDRQI